MSNSPKISSRYIIECMENPNLVASKCNVAQVSLLIHVIIMQDSPES